MENTNFLNLQPSAGGSFSYGWRKMFEKAFLPLLVAVIIAGILDGPSLGANWKWDGDGFDWPVIFMIPLALFGMAYAFLFMPIIKYGERKLFLNAMRDEEADLKVLFEGFKTQYLNIVLANLIVFALAAVGFVMLIVPGIIVVCRLVFVPFLVMDKNMEAMKAVEKSWQMTRGYGWTIFGMGIISFFVFIAGLILCFVGAIFSLMWIHSAFATFYAIISAQNNDDNPIPILGVNEEK
ncbi:hypothetical protein [uncultured Draconibacterium sp.]|mgnify:CR=1 FL=1|uniref:hypothetical protein n=1 Tax=uncultured Draconibacterium sp. TaxID=1573823 RepID=UPI003260549E